MLASLGFIEQGLNVCVPGPPDSGKSYLGKRDESLRLDTQDSSLFHSFFKAEAVGRNADAVFLTVKFCDYSEMLSVR